MCVYHVELQDIGVQCCVKQTGESVVYVGETRLPFGQQPLLLYDGQLTLQTSSGALQTMILDSHDFMTAANQRSDKQVGTATLSAGWFARQSQ